MPPLTPPWVRLTNLLEGSLALGVAKIALPLQPQALCSTRCLGPDQNRANNLQQVSPNVGFRAVHLIFTLFYNGFCQKCGCGYSVFIEI